MATTISTRNTKSQDQIFLGEITDGSIAPLHYDMAKRSDDEPPQIYLGDWLEEFDIDNGKAAKIAGCDQSYISNIVANRKPNVNVLILYRLSEEMEVTINDFYRPLPSKSQLAALKNLSPKAQATLLARFQKKA